MPDNDTYTLAQKVAQYAQTKKAQDIRLLHLKNISSVTDFFVICHGDSSIQVKAIANAILDGLREEGVKVWHKEGTDFLNWVLLDYIDVVVHVFQKETREFYNLERLWADAKIETLSE